MDVYMKITDAHKGLTPQVFIEAEGRSVVEPGRRCLYHFPRMRLGDALVPIRALR